MKRKRVVEKENCGKRGSMGVKFAGRSSRVPSVGPARVGHLHHPHRLKIIFMSVRCRRSHATGHGHVRVSLLHALDQKVKNN